MSVTASRKTDLIKEFHKTDNDTGSPEVQVAIFSERISNLTEHLKKNPKDFHCRRGLLSLVGKRKSLLTYLKSVNETRYSDLIKRLNLRK